MSRDLLPRVRAGLAGASTGPVTSTAAVIAMVIAAVLAGALLAGCSVGPTTARSTGSATPTDPGGASAAAACRVEGFVPATRLVPLRSTPVVLYGMAYTLAPASSVGFSGDMTRIEPVRLRVRVTRGGPVRADERDAILSQAGATVVDGDVAATLPIRHRLANRTRHNQSYLFYRGARELSGRWKARRCGAPYNDGSRPVMLAGTFRTVTATNQLRLTACGRAEHGVLAAKAARYACAG